MKRAKTLWMVALAVLLLVAGLYAGERRVCRRQRRLRPTAVEEIVLVANEVVEAFARRDGERLAGRRIRTGACASRPMPTSMSRRIGSSSRAAAPLLGRRHGPRGGHADGERRADRPDAAQYVERFVLDRDYRGRAGSA